MQIEFEGGFSGVVAGLSERSDGNMVWSNTLPVNEIVRANRDSFFTQQGIEPKRVVAGGIAHGIHVTRVGDSDAGKYILDSDALVTDTPDLYLTVTVADCVPVYFFDPVKKCIGMAHAGWRGLVAGVLEKTVQEMRRGFFSEARDIRAVVGPHIRVCHYEVGSEVADRFDPENVENCEGKMYVNLTRESVRRLQTAGVVDITADPICTFCAADRLYSARHDMTKPVQGMVAYIGLRP